MKECSEDFFKAILIYQGLTIFVGELGLGQYGRPYWDFLLRIVPSANQGADADSAFAPAMRSCQSGQ
jgi:hypothetical protein